MAQVSKPEDFVRDTLEIDLPRTQAGKKLRMRIRALSKGEWMVAQGDCPTIFQDKERSTLLTEEENGRLIAMARRIAEAAVIEPALCFDAREPDKAFWDDVASENQDYVVEQVAIFSGYAKKPTGEAEKIATFLAGAPRTGAAGVAPVPGGSRASA